MVRLALIGASAFAIAVACSFARRTPRYLPDEFLYAQLSRSLAAGRGLRVLGESSSLPSQLEPLITAVFWAAGDAALAFRSTQVVHGLFMSLAVVPVFMLARRLSIRAPLALASAAVVAVSPDLVYAGYATADALGYLLALTTITVGVDLLAQPARRTEAAFVALAGFSAFARLQYLVLLPAFVLAALVVERGSLRTVCRHFALVNATLIAGLALVLSRGGDTLGRYQSIREFEVSREMLRWAAVSGFLLCLSAGAALAPAALSWLGSALVRPPSPRRGAFAALTVWLVLGLLVLAAVMAVGSGSNRFFERYLIVCVPLLTLACCCWIEDGRPGRRAVIALSNALVLVAMRLPVSEYVVGQGSSDSPFLLAVRELGRVVGVETAALLVVLAAAGAAAASAAAALRSRLAVAPLIASLMFLAVASVGAHATDIELSRAVASSTLAREPDWVDRTGAHNVVLVQTRGSSPATAMQQAFWNLVLRHGVLLGTAVAPMDGANERMQVAHDGTLMLNGRAVEQPLLVATSGSTPVFAGERVLSAAAGFSLVIPAPRVRLLALAQGMRGDGWLAPRADLTVWPHGVARCVSVALAGRQDGGGAVRISFHMHSVHTVVRVRPRERVTVQLPVRAGSPWHASLTADRWTTLPSGVPVVVQAALRLTSVRVPGRDCAPTIARSAA